MKMPIPENKYISLQEASKRCDYSQEYLSLMARRGSLRALKIGRNWVTTIEWLEEYLKEYISLQEASQYCGYSQEYLSLRSRQGLLKSVKIGRNWATTKEWLKEYLAKNGKPEGLSEAGVKEPVPEIEPTEPEWLLPRSPKSRISVSKWILKPIVGLGLILVLVITGLMVKESGLDSYVSDALNNFTKIPSQEQPGYPKNYGQWLGFQALNGARKIVSGYLAANNFLEDKIFSFFQKTFSPLGFLFKPWQEKAEPFLRDLADLKKEVKNLKEKGIVREKTIEKIFTKEITREVTHVTQVEPIKEITRDVMIVDETNLNQVRAQLADVQTELRRQSFNPGSVIYQTTVYNAPVEPKLYQENGNIILQTAGSGNIILTAATAVQISGQQVVIDSTSLANPLIYLSDNTEVNGSLTAQRVIISAPAGFTGNAFDVQVGGVSVFSIDETGKATLAGGNIVMRSTKWIGLGSSSGRLVFTDDTTDSLTVSDAHLLFSADNSFDIGSSGALRPRTGYFATSVLAGSSAFNEASLNFANTGALTTTAGALALQPASGQNLNVSLSGTGDLAVNTNQFYVDTSSGNVGIGTTSPAYKLEVNGTLGVGSTAYFASLVGIGTTAPGYALEVAGTFKANTAAPVFGSYTLTIPATGTVTEGTGTANYAAYWTGANTVASEQYLAVSRGGTGAGSLNDLITLGTHTTGNYVASVATATLTGLTGGAAGSEGAALSLAFDYSTALSGDPALAANNVIFGTNGLIFEGATANTFETFLTLTDPTADRTITLPNETGTVCTTGSVCSGYQASGSYAPADATYLTQTANGTLTAEQALASLATGLMQVTTTTGVVTSVTTSAGISSLLSDETGSGAMVFGTSPTFTTSIIDPLVYGGTAANDDLTLEGTSSATKTTSYVILQPTSGNVGIGTTAPGYALEVNGTFKANTSTPVFGAYTLTVPATGTVTEGTGTANYAAYWTGANTVAAEQYLSVTRGGTGAGTLNDLITLGTHTTGNYVATIADSGASTITVANSGTENAAITLGITANSIGDTQLAYDTGQALTTASSPSFTGLTVSGLSINSAVYTNGSSALTSTAPTSGTLGYWQRNSTNVAPATIADNVGIGTTSPAYKLEVNGSLGVGSTAYFASNVGIGTTAPAQKLEVSGAAMRLRITDINVANASWDLMAQTNNTTKLFRIYDSSASSDRLVIDSSGNVGIGTAGPGVKLDILSGTANTAGDSVTGSVVKITGPDVPFGTSSNNGGLLNIDTNDAMGIDIGGSIGFGGRYITASTAQAQWALIKGGKTNATTGNYSGYLAFGTRTSGTVVSEKMRIDNAGNVGIGTTSPDSKLEVAQTVTATGALKGIIYTGAVNTNQTLSTEIPAVTITTAGRQWATGALATQREVLITQPTYSFVGASTITNAATVGIAGAPIKSTNATITNTHGLLIQAGAVSTATNSYGLTVNAQTGATNNYAAAFLGANVGIKDASPDAPLTIAAASTADQALYQSWRYSASSDVYTLKLKQTVTSGVVRYTFDMINNNTAYDNVLTFDRGNVGIGIVTPTAVLNIAGSQGADGSPTGGVATDTFLLSGGTGGSSTSTTTGTGGMGADFSATGGTGGVADSAATSSTGGRGGNMALVGGVGGAAMGGGPESAFQIDIGGTGGIVTIAGGTGGAVGNAITTNTAGSGGYLNIYGGAGGANSLDTGGTGGYLYLSGGVGGTGKIADGGGGVIIFRTTASSAAVSERMRITNTGDVGIGTASPTDDLHVVGFGLFASGVHIGTDVSTKLIDDASNAGGSTTLYIGSSSINVTASDIRLKENIIPSTLNALELIKKMNVVDFNWIPGQRGWDRGRATGLIAQEVYEYLPQVVDKPADPNNYWSVEYHHIVPYLILAIQEQQAEITSLLTGNIGIGTTNHDSKLTVSGNITAANEDLIFGNLTDAPNSGTCLGQQNNENQAVFPSPKEITADHIFYNVSTAKHARISSVSTCVDDTDSVWQILVLTDKVMGNSVSQGFHVYRPAGDLGNSLAGFFNNVYAINVKSVLTTVSGGSDLAQEYQTQDESIKPGDLVSIDIERPSHIVKATDSKTIGVVSTSPGILLGNETVGVWRNVALAGRVLTRVSDENGAIAIGDFVAVSSLSGIGAKATKPGFVVGRALEGFDPAKTESCSQFNCAQINIFINLTWFNGELGNDGLVVGSENQTIEKSAAFELFSQRVKEALAGLGLIIQDGIAQLKEVFADIVHVNKMEMVDQATGEAWCTWIENGEWKKIKGPCKDTALVVQTLPIQESPLSSPEVVPNSESSPIVSETPSPTPEPSVSSEPSIAPEPLIVPSETPLPSPTPSEVPAPSPEVTP